MVSKKTVAVIFGGQSSEHEVSRTSAVMMLQALDKEKYQVLSVGITKKGQWLIYNGPVEHVKTGEWEKFGTPVSLSPDATKKCFLKIVGGKCEGNPCGCGDSRAARRMGRGRHDSGAFGDGADSLCGVRRAGICRFYG